jgi:hypothetical protein
MCRCEFYLNVQRGGALHLPGVLATHGTGDSSSVS